MNPSKSVLKIEIVQSMGEDVEKQRDAARAEEYRYEGAKSALVQTTKNIDGLFSFVDKDIEGGKLDLEGAKKVKDYVMKARGCCVALAGHADVQIQVSRGKVLAFECVLALLHKQKESEESKLKALSEALQAGDAVLEEGQPTAAGIKRPQGVHPGPGIAAMRKAEELKQTTPQESTSVVEPVPTPVVQGAPTTPPAKAVEQKKPRTRRA